MECMGNPLTYDQMMLRAVRGAIYELVTGGAQSASISVGTGSQSYTRLDLDKLYQMERHFSERVAAASPGGLARFTVKPDFGGHL